MAPAKITWYTASHRAAPIMTYARSVRGRLRVASSVTVASGIVRTSSAGNRGSPGSDKRKRPSGRRYCGGATRTTVARTVSAPPPARGRTKPSVCPMARSMAAAWPVAGRAVADTKATAVSGENSVAGSSPSSFKVSVLRPFSSGWGSARRTTTRPSL